jgi:hypothetical protein
VSGKRARYGNQAERDTPCLDRERPSVEILNRLLELEDPPLEAQSSVEHRSCGLLFGEG